MSLHTEDAVSASPVDSAAARPNRSDALPSGGSTLPRTIAPPVTDYAEDEEDYRRLSKMAVMSLMLALLSVGGLAFVSLAALGVMAVVLGLVAVNRIKNYPEELTGTSLATAGAALGGLFLVAGIGIYTWTYYTEAPPNARRITFWDLQADSEGNEPYSETARALNGERVFIKGYIHPSVDGQGAVNRFVLVPDFGTCCFGGKPKLTHMMDVKLEDPLAVRYNLMRQRLAGRFRFDGYLHNVPGFDGAFFRLDGDFLNGQFAKPETPDTPVTAGSASSEIPANET